MEQQTIHNHPLQLAFDFVRYTGNNIFLTGRAGTGKTTFLHRLKELSPKRMIVVAPTGVAAINAGGVTIHSFFQLPFGPRVPGYTENEDRKGFRFSARKRNIIKSLDLLVIDEISMVRADLLDSIDERLRQFRRNDNPFGGVQLLMIGDMQQLPPVVKGDEWTLLSKFYETPFFFSSRSLKKSNYITITLEHVYRQQDQHFIELLNKIRDKKMDREALDILNKRYKPGFDPGNENYIILTTHNAKAKAINEKKLNELKGKKSHYYATVEDNFPEYMYPTEPELELKVGAQVMFVKNDPDVEKRFFNGKIGTITKLSTDYVVVQCPGDDESIHVQPLVWENVNYAIDEETKEIKETVEGTFTQMPLKLAWAITIHKSQGLTFDKAIIDSEAAFAHGQVYVALSRCRSLEGMVLSTPFSPYSLKQDSSIEGFNKLVSKSQPDDQKLEASKAKYQLEVLEDLFDFSSIRYAINGLDKVLYDSYQSLPPDAAAPVKSVKEQVAKEIIEVSEKFRNQIRHLLGKNSNAEENTELQERIKKAVDYFAGKIKEQVLNKLEELSFETDNAEVMKKITKQEERIYAVTQFKLTCLEGCREGFVLKDYLKARAKASLEEAPKKTPARKTKLPVSREISNPGLYDLLKDWRNARAIEEGLPHYMVLPLRTIRALSNQAPASMDELKRVHGFGRKKLQNYGEELLELINDYRRDHELKTEPLPEPVKKEKKPKIDTRKVSLELWLKHKDLKKVAEERDLAVSTIAGHLARFVGTGELPVTDFVDEKKLEKLLAFFRKNPDITLGEAKEKLGDDVSYGELRMVRQHLVWEAGKE
ncbi:MAG: AAA family ATPase [Chlorobi bacterium]|nr:AAA family ATPase [Chlorobiota bacterium]